MSKKGGLFTLITGFVAGAAAAFLSDEKNREKAEVEVKKVARQAKALKAEYEQDPEGTKRKIAGAAKRKAKKVIGKVKKVTAAKRRRAKK